MTERRTTNQAAGRPALVVIRGGTPPRRRRRAVPLPPVWLRYDIWRLVMDRGALPEPEIVETFTYRARAETVHRAVSWLVRHRLAARQQRPVAGGWQRWVVAIPRCERCQTRAWGDALAQEGR